MPGSTGSITTQNLNASGQATPGSAVLLNVDPNGFVIGVEVSGTWTGTLTPQVTEDGQNWLSLSSTTLTSTSGTTSGTISSGSTGLWSAFVVGAQAFRIVATTAVTGLALVSLAETTR